MAQNTITNYIKYTDIARPQEIDLNRVISGGCGHL